MSSALQASAVLNLDPNLPTLPLKTPNYMGHFISAYLPSASTMTTVAIHVGLFVAAALIIIGLVALIRMAWNHWVNPVSDLAQTKSIESSSAEKNNTPTIITNLDHVNHTLKIFAEDYKQKLISSYIVDYRLWVNIPDNEPNKLQVFFPEYSTESSFSAALFLNEQSKLMNRLILPEKPITALHGMIIMKDLQETDYFFHWSYDNEKEFHSSIEKLPSDPQAILKMLKKIGLSPEEVQSEYSKLPKNWKEKAPEILN